MQVGHFESAGMFTSDGIRLTNFSPDLRAPSSGSPPMGWLRTFPADGVALQVWFGERFAPAPPLSDTQFPLSRGLFSPIKPYVGGDEPAPMFGMFNADGFGYDVAIWFGARSSDSDQQAIWTALDSMRFPSLEEGTIWQDRYYVLKPASSYAIGSVTAIPAGSLPTDASSFAQPMGFYLIHAPRAFYAIEQTFQNGVSPSETCRVIFDPGTFQFFCPGTAWRWDRMGRPLGVHAGEGNGALSLHIVTVAQDGHLLYSPFFGGLLGFVLNGDPWG